MEHYWKTRAAFSLFPAGLMHRPVYKGDSRGMSPFSRFIGVYNFFVKPSLHLVSRLNGLAPLNLSEFPIVNEASITDAFVVVTAVPSSKMIHPSLLPTGIRVGARER